MHKLIKASEPGWEKEFATKEEARIELLSHICGSCLTGQQEYVGGNGKIEIHSEPAPDKGKIEELLVTSCGCEFWYEPTAH